MLGVSCDWNDRVMVPVVRGKLQEVHAAKRPTQHECQIHALTYVICVFCAVPQPGQVRYEPHMLDSAASPLVAALPQYERGFLDHLSAGGAYWGAIQVRCFIMHGAEAKPPSGWRRQGPSYTGLCLRS